MQAGSSENKGENGCKSDMKRPKVSVTFPTWNEERFLERCLTSLLEQDFKEYLEIVIVDGNSKDKTVDIIRKFQKKTKPNRRIVLIRGRDNNTAKNRNIAIKSSKADYIMQFSGHCYAEKNMISTLYRRLKEVEKRKDNRIIGVGCRHENPKDGSKIARIIGKVMESPFGGFGTTHIQEEKETLMESVAFMVYNKKIHDKIGYFDPKFHVGQDAELNLRIRLAGYQLLYTPKTKAYHYKRSSLKEHYNRMVKYGYARAKIIIKHKDTFKAHYIMPAMFSMYIIVGIPIITLLSILNKAWLWLFIPAILYIIMIITNGTIIAKKNHGKKDNNILMYMLITFLTHYGYGIGFVKGLIK